MSYFKALTHLKRRLKNRIGKVEQTKLVLLKQNLKEIMGLADRIEQEKIITLINLILS
jgi:hypothetical protein